jgi:hypothetical protein
MKPAGLCILFLALISGGVVWAQDRDDVAKPPQKAPDEKSGGEEAQTTTVTHDTNGNVVIHMSDETQGDAGIVVTNAPAGQWSPELRGYGRVLDPAPLASMVNELSSAQAAYAASSRDYERLKALSEQSNASARALENARAASLRDQLAIQSLHDRLDLLWGNVLAGQNDLAAFIQTLITRDRVLLRVDLPAGQTLDGPRAEARVVTLSGRMTEAKFLGPAPATDPQLQGQGFILSIQPNALSLAFGQAVSGYLKVPGEPVKGVIVPREAVVRTQGAAWVYVMNAGGESFTRREISLDRPAERGWFVSSGITPRDYLVDVGAQTLLSEELKGALKPD